MSRRMPLLRETCLVLAVLAAPVSAFAAGKEASPCGRYKMDGTGNCLTPAFYRCTKAWAACSKACEKKPNAAKCAEACDEKYSQQCGD